MRKRTFVIGDIHGCKKTLEFLLFESCKFTEDDCLYLLGDYIGSGPRIKETIDFILELQVNNYSVKCLRGNHEDMLLKSMIDEKYYKRWIEHSSGNHMLKEFQVNSADELPEKYLFFFNKLNFYFVLDKFILTHGGLNTKIENPFEDLKAMIWSRTEDIDLQKTGNRKLIVGHTPKPLYIIKKSLKENVIFLDGGCVYSHSNRRFGYLCCLELNSMELFTQRNLDF